MKIGILAVQGAFIEHEKILTELGAQCIELRKKSDLKASLDGIVLAGGESTVQGKLLRELDMFDELKNMIESGVPTLATCAGMILLAEKLTNDENTYFGTMPITVKRNAYGRQLGSFEHLGNVKGIGNFPMVFIRAPYVESADSKCEILAMVDGKTVGVRYKNQIALAFHPELTDDYRIHRMFTENLA